MSKQFKEVLIIVIFILSIIGIYFFVTYFDYNSIISGSSSNKFLIGIAILFVLISLGLIINYVRNISKNKELKHRDRLFNSLTKNGDTIYFLYDTKTKKVTYVSKNIEEVLGINTTDGDMVLNKILGLPVLQNELRSWDKEKEFVSQMILYQDLAYQYERWIKVKIYPYKEKKLQYNVILVSDVTTEHDRQHLLVSQASDIKVREKQLNQITAISYDIEMDLNLETETVSKTNLKEINILGENKIGKYTEIIDEMLDNYIYDANIQEFKSLFSIDNFNKQFESKTLEPISVRYKLKDNKTWLESTAFLSFQKGCRIVTILTKDVTANAEYMRNQNIMLQNALKSAELANKSKTNFLSTISHEIRSSMNAILGLSESVLNTELTEEVKEDVENINSASNNILEVIDGMLDISKVESGILELNEKEYDVVKLFKDVINIAKQNVDKKNVKFALNISKEIPASLYGDAGKVRQILLNLLETSINNTKKGTIIVNVEMDKRKSDVNLIINIEDDNIGIDPKDVENAFNDNNDVAFSVVKKLIDLLKGSLSIESINDKGIKFELQIIQRCNNEILVGEVKEETVTKKKSLVYKTKDKKILIVDDNKLDQKVASRLLKDSGIEIETVDSGQECIDLIKSGKKYDLILLDQMMPNMDGIETLQELKKIPNYNIPTIMLTADAMVGKKEEYLKAGFNDYLSKPIVIDELNRVLKKNLDKEK